MKQKVILINVLLFIIFASSVVGFSVLIGTTSHHWNYYNDTCKSLLEFVTNEYNIAEIKAYYNECIMLTVSISFSVLGTVLSAFLIVFLNFKIFNSVSFAELQANMKEKTENRKAEREQAKIEKEEADKQAKIKALEQELESLKGSK